MPLDLGQREGAHACGRQLDRQRYAGNVLADPHNRQQHWPVKHQRWLNLDGPLHKQFDGAVAGQFCQQFGRICPCWLFGRVSQPADIKQPFGPYIKPLA